MSIVQEIDFKTKNGLIIKAHIERIDNICNCPFLSKDQEELICSPLIKVFVNGQ